MAQRDEFDIFNERLPTLRDFAKEIPEAKPISSASRSQIDQLMREATRVSSAGTRGLAGLTGLATAINRERAAETRAADRKAKADAKAAKAAGVAGITAAVGQPGSGVASWDQVRGAISGWDQLPYSEQIKAYDQYVKTATESLKKANPTADETELEFQLRQQAPGPSAPERSALQMLTDPLAGVGAGLISFGGTLAQAATGGVPNAVSRALLGQAQDTRNALSDVELDAARQRQFDDAALQAENRSLPGQFIGEAGNALSNLSVAQAAELLGSAVPSLAAGGGVTSLAGRLGLGRSAQALAGTAAGAALEGASSAGDAGNQAYEAITTAPIEQLRQSPYWASALQAAGGDEAAARVNLAERGARLAAGVGGSTGVLLSILPGSLERSVSGAVARRAAGEAVAPVTRQGIGRVVAGRAGEAGVEGLTEASTTVAGNIGGAQANGDYTPAALARGAGGDFALGALAGGVVGSAVEGLQRTGEQGAAQPEAGAAPRVPGLQPDAAPAQPGEVVVEGARLVQTPDGRWAYAEGETANPVADDYLRGVNELPDADGTEPTDAAVPQPDAAVEPDNAAVPQPDATVEPTNAAVEPQDAVAPPADLGAEGSGNALGGGMAGAINDNFYNGWFDLLARREGASGAFRSEPRYAETRAAYDAGLITSAADLRAFLTGEQPAPSALPREQVGADAEGWVNTNAQLARDQSDRAGLTAEIESLFADGLTAAQVQERLGSRLDFIPAEDRGSFVVQVRATLGIPSRADAEGQAEFDRWLQARQQREPAPAAEPVLPPAQPDPVTVPLPQELDSDAEQVQRLQAFSTALSEEAAAAGPAVEQALARLNQRIAEQTAQGGIDAGLYSSALTSSTIQIPGVAGAIERAAQRVGGLRPADWTNATADTALATAVSNTGIGITAAGDSQWAQAFRRSVRNGDGGAVLAAIATDPVLPATVRQGAQSVIDAYQASGIRLPQLRQLSERQAAPRDGGLPGGFYSPGAHQVRARADTSPHTLIHEYLHGLTVRGLDRMRQRQPRQARNMDALLNEIAAQARNAVPDASRPGYALTQQVRERGHTGYELLAELFSPPYLDLMGRVQLDETALTPAARAALDTLQQPSDGTLRSLFRRAVQKILSYATPRVPSERSLAQVLADVSQPLAQQTRQSLAETDAVNNPPAPSQPPAAGAEGPQALRTAKPRYSYGNKQFTLDFESALDKARFLISGTRRPANYDTYLRWAQEQTGQTEAALRVQGLRLRRDIKARAAAASSGGRMQVGSSIEQSSPAAGQEPAPDGQVLNDQDLLQPSNRDNYRDLIGDLQDRRAAEPATPVRGFLQSLRRGAGEERRAYAQRTLDAVNEAVHDHLTPFKRWVQRMPNVAERIKTDILATLYAAPNVRDQQMGTGMQRYGGERIQRIIGSIAAANNITTETALRNAGYWLTARRAPSANTRLRQRAVDRVTEIGQQLQRQDLSDAERQSLQGQLELAERDLGRVTAAIYNPDANVTQHVAGVAGFSNAQAAQVRQAVEAMIPRQQLDELAEQVSRLNGWRLTLDLQTGKVSPRTAAEFIGRPETQEQMEAFIAAHNALDATDPATVAEYERQRDALVEAVRDDYVPLTGNPQDAGDDGFISSGTRQPNQARDYAMEGRTSSIPDDGLSASFASIIRSTSYAGWAPFQDSIARLYDALSPEQREQVGIFRRTLGENASGLNEPGVVRRRGNQVQAYTFSEPGFIEAIRGANIDGGGQLSEFFGKPTQWFSYLATQFNPFFAPRNYIRDGWERTELVRSRDIRDANGNVVDGNRVARQALANTFGPAGAAGIMRATAAYAMGRQLDTSSREGAMLREFLDNGGASTWGDRFSPRQREVVKNIERFQGLARNARRGVADLTDAYNRVFDVGPALGMYMALRGNNVSARDAAALTLDQMNFRKRGAIMALPRMLYAFAQPSVTGGANTLGSLYNGATGRVVRSGVTRLAGMSVALIMLQSVLRSMAGDDEGGNKLDQMSEYDKDNFLLVPVPGTERVVKIPLAFGLPRIANAIALSSIGAATKEMSPKEAGVKLGSNLIPVFSPLESVDIDASKRPTEWLMHTFAPSWLKGVVAVGSNRTSYDAPVVFDKFQDMTKYRSEQFGYNTPEFYRDVARTLREYTGIDQAPEEVKAMIKSIPMGAFSQALNGMVDVPFRREQGKSVPNPVTGQYLTGYSPYGISSQFYDVLDDSQEAQRKLNAGGKLSEDERKEIMWLRWWDAQDKQLRKEKAAITRDKTLSEQARERRRAEADAKRQRVQAQAVVLYRTSKGLPVGRTN